MINIPPDIFNRMTGQQPQQEGGTFTASGQPYSGPFGNDTRTPFRTVEGIGQYGNGLNASAAQMYDHFRGTGRLGMDHGLRKAGKVQSLEDFANRGALAGPSMPTDPNKLAFGDLTNDRSVLKFMGQNGGISAGDLDWMSRWFNEGNSNNGTGWVTGDVRGWQDQWNLSSENQGIVGRAMDYMSNYWKPWEEQGAGMPADPQPTMPSMGGGIFNMPPGGIRL